MAVRVRIPTPLRKHTGDKAEVAAEGATIKEVFGHLERQFPGFRQALYDEDGTLRRFINVYLNDEDIRYIGGESVPVESGSVVSIVPAIAGGRSVVREACAYRRPLRFKALSSGPLRHRRGFGKVGLGA